MDGVLVLDKPRGISSHDAVQKLRRLLNIRRIGHLGTLDPLGTGVLPMVVGKATRLSQFFLGHEREYEARIRVGFATTTYDSDGEPTGPATPVRLEREAVEAALGRFRGVIAQTPPAVSAKKIGGVPAYKLVRREQPVDLAPVEVEVYGLDCLELGEDWFRIRFACSAGAYVRSLAHDVGALLGPGAHVTELRRTAMGEFDLGLAHTFQELEALREQGRMEEAFVPAERLLPEMPVRRVDAETVVRIGRGQDFRVSGFGPEPAARRVKAVGPAGDLIAIGEVRLPNVYHPIVVF
jgi:tRNA pseudouridine55 synthase